MKDLKPLIRNILPGVISLRHDLHAHPEPGYKEERTASKVIEHLEKMPGMEIRSGIAGTGVVATLGGGKPGPCVALRADMDCLPLTEATGVSYASKNPGFMHACGHDGHTATLIGAASVLSQIADELQGPVKFIFQPAEEGGAGAEKMCREGVLENPTVDAIFGLHNNPGFDSEFGRISTRAGSFMGASGMFEITIHGLGGHAAKPDQCIDPIYIGLQLGNALQSIVARSTDPVKGGVVSITQFQAGTAFNIIPESAKLGGTFRSLDAGVHRQTEEKIRNLSDGICRTFGARCEVNVDPGYPVLVNHERTCRLFSNLIQELPGYRGKLDANMNPIMAGEDFAYYTQRIPGTFWFLGTRPPGRKDYPFCHNPAFDFNDDILPVGIEIHVETARRFARLWETT